MQPDPAEPTKGPGRPPKAPDTKATGQIQLRVTTRRKTAYVRAANAEGQTLADWMFTHCDKAANFNPEA